MSVDPYALCPCGSGKKLKFCCSDLAGEIEKIHRMIEGDQPRAALQHIEQALRKRPGRASLLDIKAVVEFSLEQFDSAAATIESMLKGEPHNPSAHAHAAMLACVREHPQSAVACLQDAIERITEDMPLRVLEAIGAVGHMLLLSGDVVAARAHLWLYQGIAGREDTRAMKLIISLNRLPGLPLLLRDNLYLQETPEGHPADHPNYQAQVLASHGRWRMAAALLTELAAKHPDVVAVRYNLAVVNGWLGDQEKFCKGLRWYAQQDIPHADAVEAEAIVQLLNRNIAEESVDTQHTRFPIVDEGLALERLASDRRLQPQVGAFTFEEFEGSPAPRAEYLILDRPLPSSGAELTRDQVPNVLGQLGYFGRQTDRQERLEMLSLGGEETERATALLSEVLGDSLGAAELLESLGKTSKSDNLLGWRWAFPPDTPPELARRLRAEELRSRILNVWPEISRPSLGGATPRQASQRPEQRIPLEAAVLILEQGSYKTGYADIVAELRQNLGLNPAQTIDGAELGEDLDRVPLVRVKQLDLAAVADEPLVQLYRRAVLANASGAIEVAGKEILRRPSLAERIKPDEVYMQLVQHAEEPEQALGLATQAAQRSVQENRTPSAWEVVQFELLIEMGKQEEAIAKLDLIRNKYFNEPGIAERVYEILYSIGAIAPGAGPELEASLAEPAPAAAGSTIWTPGGEAAAAGGKKLWTPG